MSVEKTLSIIKPDAVKRDLTGKIIAMFEEKGLRVVAQKKIWLSKEQAGSFYDVHRDRPFFGELCEFMSSGPIVVQVLEGNSAIELNREIMGATNPDQADAGTIRKEFALSMTENSAHGSDSPETAREEISFFFSGLEILQF
jgi:nucleoside-diphosphate kinase